jgi:hypothetical protein
MQLKEAEDNDDLFYDAVALTYDRNRLVSEYFHSDWQSHLTGGTDASEVNSLM